MEIGSLRPSLRSSSDQSHPSDLELKHTHAYTNGGYPTHAHLAPERRTLANPPPSTNCVAAEVRRWAPALNRHPISTKAHGIEHDPQLREMGLT
jgi:hypothetical protein